MKTLAISDFKAHALRVIGEVAETRVPVVITRRGQPLAEVVPYTPGPAVEGKLSETLVFEKDIVSPLGEEIWDACR
ncbi:MAG: type II toxin-antitoxin system Phd/YefM family antitoxin [Candidatus Erginobacter occultus]|nr:type II toxin-antitoxin system Phd/YefM family antitoxin [Candidatus Erginobacter occultus]